MIASAYSRGLAQRDRMVLMSIELNGVPTYSTVGFYLLTRAFKAMVDHAGAKPFN